MWNVSLFRGNFINWCKLFLVNSLIFLGSLQDVSPTLFSIFGICLDFCVQSLHSCFVFSPPADGQRQEVSIGGGASRQCFYDLTPSSQYQISVHTQLQEMEGPPVSITDMTCMCDSVDVLLIQPGLNCHHWVYYRTKRQKMSVSDSHFSTFILPPWFP